MPQLLSPHATTTEARVPRAHAPQLEKARAQQQRPNTAKKKLKNKKEIKEELHRDVLFIV